MGARLLAFAIVLAPALALAAGKRSFAVHVSPPGWRADALAQTLATDLADDQLAVGAPELDVDVRIGANALAYDLFARWPGAPAPVHGTIAFGRDRVAVAGVLRDRVHRLARTSTDDTAEATASIELPSVPAVGLGFAIAALVLASPFVYAFVRRKRVPGVAIRRVAIAFGVAGAIAIAALAFGGSNPGGVALGIGGAAWGGVLAVTLPVVFPPLAGLGRAEYAELGPALRAWSLVVVLRAVAVAIVFAPIVVGGFVIGGALALAVAAPVAMLVARLWLRAVVAVAADALDDRYIDRDADTAAWDAATRAYLVGYFRRNGIPADHVLLSRVQLLPGRDVFACYGGGLVPSRIVVPRRMLELALAPTGRPHDYAAPRVSTLHWTQWNAGLVVPTEAGAKLASAEQRQVHNLTDDGEFEREPLGEPPTLAGIIEPEDLDPRKSYRPHDDPLWLDWDPGEDYDGTDAGDRDFLFGALVRALGDIQRGTARTNTLVLFARGRLARVLAVIARPSEALADIHAALAGARHHLVQYVAYQRWQREDLLTARAYAPELEAKAREILALPEPDRHLATLAVLVRGAARVRPARWRRFAVAGAIVVGAGAALVAVVDAVRYHATYQQRVEKPDGKD